MKLQKIIIKVLDKESPQIKRKNWKNSKKLQLNFPNSFNILLLDKNNNIIDDFYSFSQVDWEATDWKIIK